MGVRTVLLAVSACLSLMLALGAVACSGGDNGEARPQPDELEPGTVAAVGDREISREAVEERAAEVRRANRRGDGTIDAEEVDRQAVASLLEEAAVEQEAEDRGISVSEREMRRRWRGASASQFRNQAQLRRFLGGQTVDEVVAQLRLQELRERIHEQVRAEADGDPAQAVQQWESEFRERWRDATACRDGYRAPGCPGE